MYNNPPMFMPPQEPKCCGCISLRLGSGIICLIWAVRSYIKIKNLHVYQTILLFRHFQCI